MIRNIKFFVNLGTKQGSFAFTMHVQFHAFQVCLWEVPHQSFERMHNAPNCLSGRHWTTRVRKSNKLSNDSASALSTKFYCIYFFFASGNTRFWDSV